MLVVQLYAELYSEDDDLQVLPSSTIEGWEK